MNPKISVFSKGARRFRQSPSAFSEQDIVREASRIIEKARADAKKRRPPFPPGFWLGAGAASALWLLLILLF